MKIINATTIGNLISAHMEGDEEKFLSFANFIADAYEEAVIQLCLSGEPKYNKANLSLLGTPIWIGTIEELSNRSDLWSKYVYDCRIFGLFRNKIQIIIEDS